MACGGKVTTLPGLTSRSNPLIRLSRIVVDYLELISTTTANCMRNSISAEPSGTGWFQGVGQVGRETQVMTVNILSYQQSAAASAARTE